jgi:DNA-binding transcriptional regulator/RsmH inhibitor MraZ
MQRWVLKVEKQHRLRLTPEIVAQIPWLAKADGPVTVSAIVDEHGGVRLLAPKSSHHKRHEEIAKRLSEAADEDENSAAVLSLARHSANRVSLTFSKDRSRISVVLPRELRSQGAPAKGEDAVIFIYGKRVEIWHARAWASHLRSVDGKHEDLIEESSDDLGIEDGG